MVPISTRTNNWGQTMGASTNRQQTCHQHKSTEVKKYLTTSKRMELSLTLSFVHRITFTAIVLLCPYTWRYSICSIQINPETIRQLISMFQSPLELTLSKSYQQMKINPFTNPLQSYNAQSIFSYYIIIFIHNITCQD